VELALGLSSEGEHGFVHLRAPHAPAGAPVAPLSAQNYAATLDRAYRGLWGHKCVAPDAEPPPDTTVVGLVEDGRAIGLCTVSLGERLIDAPGLVPETRTVERYVRLLEGACALLAPGPAELVSWGDDPAVVAAYVARGFEVVERTAGWSIQL
jgi:hypothetical protein